MPAVDQTLAVLTQHLVGLAMQCGHTLIVIDHREQMTSLLDNDDTQLVLVDFGRKGYLNPLSKGFFDQPHLVALCITNSVVRQANAWGERLRNTISSQAVVAWL